MTNKKNIYEFKKSLNVGNAGEEKIKQFLLSLSNIESVKSVQNIKKYQDEDIDFIVTFKNKKQYTVEVKTDTYTSGNLYYETVSCAEKNTLGCLEKTKADFIFYYFAKYDRLYILKTNSFRLWVKQEIAKFKKDPKKSVLDKKEVLNKITFGSKKGTYTSEGYTIPLSYMENALLNTKVYKRFNSVSSQIKANIA